MHEQLTLIYLKGQYEGGHRWKPKALGNEVEFLNVTESIDYYCYYAFIMYIS